MLRPNTPWYITIAACEQYAAILGLDPEIDDDFTICEDELGEIAQAAEFAKIYEGGLHEYRATVPPGSRPMLPSREHRLILLVSTEPRPEGKLPQLVRVKLRGSR